MREKILRSLNSSDLSNEEWENHAHVVASLGACQIGGNRKHLSIGALLLRVRAGQAQFAPRALALLAPYVASQARRKAWKGIGRHNAYLLCQIALDRFLDVLCAPCHGVGKIGELGRVIIICQSCKGTGKRKDSALDLAEALGMTLQQIRAFEIQERVNDVLSMMERMEGYASGGTREQARGRAEHNI
jgi:hypothetical protein